jgi:hypothetical protein
MRSEPCLAVGLIRFDATPEPSLVEARGECSGTGVLSYAAQICSVRLRQPLKKKSSSYIEIFSTVGVTRLAMKH